LKAWQPILTPIPVIITFLVIGIVFIPIGVAMIVASDQVVEASFRYDNLPDCALNTTCTVPLTVSQKMVAPIYLYYQLENFHQNHRRYVKSRSDAQLRGDLVPASQMTDCDPRLFDPKGKIYYPCGLIAASLFNDTISMQAPDGKDVVLRKKGIAWPSDVETKFKVPTQPIDLNVYTLALPGNMAVTDEDFIVWMRTAALPNFKKLYRIIDTDLEPGVYSFTIVNNYPVFQFQGTKSIFVSNTSWVGGKNNFLGFCYVIIGAVCILFAIVFAIKQKIAPRKIGLKHK